MARVEMVPTWKLLAVFVAFLAGSSYYHLAGKTILQNNWLLPQWLFFKLWEHHFHFIWENAWEAAFPSLFLSYQLCCIVCSQGPPGSVLMGVVSYFCIWQQRAAGFNQHFFGDFFLMCKKLIPQNQAQHGVTLGNVPCNLCCNFVARHVAWKLPCVTYAATDISRFIAVTVAKSRTRFYFSHRLRQRGNDFFFSNIAQCNTATMIRTACLAKICVYQPIKSKNVQLILVSPLRWLLRNKLQESLHSVTPFQQLVSQAAKHRCETSCTNHCLV